MNGGFEVGEYVIADHAIGDDWSGYTWEVTSFGLNLFMEPIVRVRDIANPNTQVVFYPSELSWEDGSRPQE